MPEVGNLEWVELELKKPELAPSMRTGHSLSVIGLPNNPTAVIIGGCTPSGVVNDVFTMKMGQEALDWNKAIKIGQPDQAPSPRWRHTATVLPGGKSIFIFGGMDQQKRYDDCFILEDKGSNIMRWKHVEASGQVPPPRANHTATMVGEKGEEKIYVIGGYGGDRKSVV